MPFFWKLVKQAVYTTSLLPREARRQKRLRKSEFIISSRACAAREPSVVLAASKLGGHIFYESLYLLVFAKCLPMCFQATLH